MYIYIYSKLFDILYNLNLKFFDMLQILFEWGKLFDDKIVMLHACIYVSHVYNTP